MAKTVSPSSSSWMAVSSNGELCLDLSRFPPLPRGWERCLDLQSGVMYVKEMNAQRARLPSRYCDGHRNPVNKRRKLFSDDDEANGPCLQLSLSLPAHTLPRKNVAYLSAGTTALYDEQYGVRHDTKRVNSPSTSDSSSPLLRNGFCSLQKGDKKEEGCASPSSSKAASSCCISSAPLHQSGKTPDIGLNVMSPIRAAGCPHCFMYVLSCKQNPKCPRCKSPILVDLAPIPTSWSNVLPSLSTCN